MKKFIFVLLVSSLTITGAWAVTAQPWAGVKAPNLKAGDPLPGNLFIELAKAINPGVVNISTSALPRSVQRDPMLDMLERFYGAPIRPQGNKPQPIGLGTGFVVRDDGLIVTNAHVIRGADVITIQFEEGSLKTYDAQVLGSDDRSDIAVLKIKPDGKVTSLALGSSEKTEIGEWVAAFGNPFGHGHTMTKGIISSKGRTLEEINKFPLLQTDAPINPGNSGGPLVNSRGEVIGVNSAINAQAQGISFAIPIDEVKRLLPQLEKGSLRKGYIGVTLGDIVSYTDESAEGAGIAGLDPRGPAAKAGLKLYDVVTEFSGKKIRNSTELLDAVADADPGTKVKVKLVRQEGNSARPRELSLTVGERPKEGMILGNRHMQRPPAPPAGTEVPFGLGFSVDNLTAQSRQQLDLQDEIKKPVVTDVQSGSVAAFVGIRPGDLVIEVNKAEVTTAADVVKKIKKGENVLKLARGSRIMIVSLSSP